MAVISAVRVKLVNYRLDLRGHALSFDVAPQPPHVEVARMVGHKDLRMLQSYYNETAEELAKRLD